MASAADRSKRAKWQAPAAAAVVHVLRGRYAGMTIVLLCLSLSFHAISNPEVASVVVDFAFCLLLLMAVRNVGRSLRTFTIILTLPALIGQWTLRLIDSPPHQAVVMLSSTTILAYLTLLILFNVLRDPAITSDTIVGAVCAYFMLAVTWGTAYAILEWGWPGSFAISPNLAAAANWTPPTRPLVPLLQYFSFTTISTLGFGDVSPLSPGARALTVFEGLIGQFYLAVLVARLVGIHSARVHGQ